MLSQEVIDQFLKDIHGEEGKTVLLIFADYLEENGVDVSKLRNRKVKNVGIDNVYCSNVYCGSYGAYCFGSFNYGDDYARLQLRAAFPTYGNGYRNGFGFGCGCGYGDLVDCGDGFGYGFGYGYEYGSGCGENYL